MFAIFLSCLFNDVVSIKIINDRTINGCGKIREMRIGRRNLEKTCPSTTLSTTNPT
jgi:hypothetical protein